MTQMVFGVFADEANAEDAINQLEKEGFNPKDISIVMKDKEGAKRVAQHTGSNVAEGATSGAATGAVLGGLAGLLIGIGAIAIPGIGGLLIGGPLAAALGLSGAAATTVSGAATGAVAGGLIGALTNIGVPEEEARVYEERVKSGAILVAVPAQSENKSEAASILEDNGAEQVKSVNVREGERM